MANDGELYKKCKCGCGELVKKNRSFKFSHHLRVNNPMNNPENRKKVSERKMGHEVSEETREKLRECNLGKKASEYTKAKMSQTRKGRKRPQWVIDKIHKTQKGQKRSKEFCELISKIKTEQILNSKSNTYTYCKNGYFHSNKMNDIFYYRSGTEKMFMEYCEKSDNIFSYTPKHKIYIPYVNESDGSNHNYIPDFFVNNKMIVETKGFKTEKDGYKWKAAKKYCLEKEYNFKAVFDKKLKQPDFKLIVGE